MKMLQKLTLLLFLLAAQAHATGLGGSAAGFPWPRHWLRKRPPVSTLVPLVFDDGGRLLRVPDSLSRPLQLKVDTLHQLTDKQQQAVRRELRRSLHATADSLTADSPLGRYYERLWKTNSPRTRTALANDYRQLVSQLGASSYLVGLAPTSPLYALDELLASRLSPTYSAYPLRLEPTRYAYGVKLLRTDLAKDLLLTCYATTYEQPGNEAVSRLSRDRLRLLTTQGEGWQTRLTDTLSVLDSLRRHGHPVAVSLSLLDQAYDTHRAYSSYEQTGQLFALLRTPWLQAWLWQFTNLPTLNPLPFVDDDQVPPIDPGRLQAQVLALKTYVDKTLAAKPAATKDFSVATYVEDVRFVGRGPELFTDTAAFRKARAANRAAALRFRTTRTTLNEVAVPRARPHDYFVTVLDPRTSTLATTTELRPLTVDTRLVFSVHNLAARHELKLVRLRATAITDQSAVQQAIAEGLDGLSLLKGTLGKVPAGFLSAITLPAATPKAAIRRINDYPTTEKLYSLEKASFEGSMLAIDGIRYNQTIATDRSTIEAFWQQASTRTQSAAEQELLNRTAHPFLALLPPDSLVFSQNLFNQVKKALTPEIVATLAASPDKLAAYNGLFKRVLEAYLQLFAERVARGPVVRVLREDAAFLTNSLRIVAASSPPPTPAEPLTDEVALYHSEQGVISPSDSTQAYTYGLRDITGTKVTQFATYSYRTGRLHAFQLSAGLAYTFQPVRTPEVSFPNGQVQYTSTDTRFRVYGGLHLYPGRLFLQDNRFWGRFRQRLNVLVAVGIPQPLENLYFGLGYDLGPGIKVSTGLHLHGYTRYEVYNNQLVGQAKVYEPVFPFVSLGIDPVSFVKAIALFF